MGMFKVRAKVANPFDSELSFEEDFWVDTGALFSNVPEDRLQTIGIKPLSSRNLVLANGQQERRNLGEAMFRLPELNETLTCTVIFGTKDSPYLLGATALENFCVEADPVAQKLKPMLAIMAGFRVFR